MNTRTKNLLAAVAVLTFSILACTMNLGGPPYPTPGIPVSTEAVGQLQQEIQTAVAAGQDSGEVTLVITEPELTSYLAYRLEGSSQPFITRPQVYLQDGEIQVYGTAVQGNFEITANMVLTAGVDENGQMKIELSSADFGPFPVPDGLKEFLTAIIKEATTGALGPVATGFRLETIQIADGNMTLTGRIK